MSTTDIEIARTPDGCAIPLPPMTEPKKQALLTSDQRVKLRAIHDEPAHPQGLDAQHVLGLDGSLMDEAVLRRTADAVLGPSAETPESLRARADKLDQEYREHTADYATCQPSKEAAELRARADELADGRGPSCGRCGRRYTACACPSFVDAASPAEPTKKQAHTPGPNTPPDADCFVCGATFDAHNGGDCPLLYGVARGSRFTPAPDYHAAALVPYEAGQLEARAAISYFRHFGTNAVAAAESDQLGEALAALERIAKVHLDDHEDAFEAFGMRGDIARLALVHIARATGGKTA